MEVEYRATAHIVPGLHLTVLRDISWRKRAERALQQANAAKQRVQERTAALAATNEALRQEMAERQHAEEERRRLEREAQRVQHFALLGRLAAACRMKSAIPSLRSFSTLTCWRRNSDSLVR